MSRIEIPYHTGSVSIETDTYHEITVVEPGEELQVRTGLEKQRQYVLKSLETPVGTYRLSQIAKTAKSVVIITSDHTRPVPSSITMPILLKEIRLFNPACKITILIATGLHRLTTNEELIDRFGKEIVENETIVMHDANNEIMLTSLGPLSSGFPLEINSLAASCDLLVAEGFIEPHFFAGFSGGRKSVLPGIASRASILSNHSSEMIYHRSSRAGVLEGNPIHKQMCEAAEKAGLAFIMNVIINDEKEIVHAVSGHPFLAHEAGCSWLEERISKTVLPADIVITSNGGYPLDQNVYQIVKGLSTGEKCCKSEGVIIMIAGCIDGHGGEAFYEAMHQTEDPKNLYQDICRRSSWETKDDQWEYQILCRIMKNHSVILVSDIINPVIPEYMHIPHVQTLEEAMQMAKSIKGETASINLVPEGIGVLIKQEQSK